MRFYSLVVVPASNPHPYDNSEYHPHPIYLLPPWIYNFMIYSWRPPSHHPTGCVELGRTCLAPIRSALRRLFLYCSAPGKGYFYISGPLFSFELVQTLCPRRVSTLLCFLLLLLLLFRGRIKISPEENLKGESDSEGEVTWEKGGCGGVGRV